MEVIKLELARRRSQGVDAPSDGNSLALDDGAGLDRVVLLNKLRDRLADDELVRVGGDARRLPRLDRCNARVVVLGGILLLIRSSSGLGRPRRLGCSLGSCSSGLGLLLLLLLSRLYATLELALADLLSRHGVYNRRRCAGCGRGSCSLGLHGRSGVSEPRCAGHKTLKEKCRDCVKTLAHRNFSGWNSTKGFTPRVESRRHFSRLSACERAFGGPA